MSKLSDICIRPAMWNDSTELRRLYNDIIDAMDASPWHAQWRKDGYPTDDDLQQATQRGELFVCVIEGSIAGAMILNHQFNEGYRAAAWQIECADSEILCVHTLGVSPRFQRQGVAGTMIRYAINHARNLHCKCLRLDVIDTNPPADLLYTSQSFRFIETRKLHYDSVCANFNLYEYLL